MLRPRELATCTRYDYARPCPRLRPWIERYWSVHWELGAGPALRAATLTEPCLNLTRERGDVNRADTSGAGDWLTGPVTVEHFDVRLRGTGSVIGVKFRLGATAAFTWHHPSEVLDTTIPARQWFPTIADLPELADLRTGAAVLDAWLLGQEPESPPGYERFRSVLALLADPEVTALGELSNRSGLSERTLQRMFHDHCGVGAKRILVRARVMDAVAALDGGWPGTLAELATGLGWFDQSHFSADFRRITGYRPGEYLAS